MTETACPALEATPIGGALCLFRPDSGVLGLLNGAARRTWEQSGSDGLLSLPEMAELLQPPVSYLQGNWPVAPRQAAGFEMTIGLPSRPETVRLACHEPWLAELLAAVLAPLRASSAAWPTSSIAVASTQAGDTYHLWRDGLAVGPPIRRAEVRRRTLIEIAMALLGRKHVAAVLHASAVGFKGGAVLLAGRSGAGKSTLTAVLVAAGAEYLGDDLAPLDSGGQHIRPFPLALSVKAGSSAKIAALFPELERLPVYSSHEQKIRYLPLPALANSAIVPVRAIVFPSHEPGATLVSRRLTPEEAFALLVDAGSEIAGQRSSAKPLALLAESTPAVHLTYPDTASARAAVEAIGADR